MKSRCSHSLWNGDGYYQGVEPDEEYIKKVLRLSDEAEKAFKEGCRFITGVTFDERLDNLRRQHAGLSSEERIKYIKDHWND